MTDSETIKTLAWAVVFLFGIQAGTIYAVVRLMTTGRGIFERRELHDASRPGRIVGMN